MLGQSAASPGGGLSQPLECLIIAPPLTGLQGAQGRQGRRQARKAENANTSVVVAGGIPNVFTCSIDVAKLGGIRAIAMALASSIRSRANHHGEKNGLSGLGGGGSCKLSVKKHTFHIERPNWKSDIRWASADDEATFGLFQALFDKLGIAAEFGFLGPMTLFSGFLVIRQCTRKSHFHADFTDTGGRAFTLMTPLEDMSDLWDCHLVVKLPHDGSDEGSSADTTEDMRQMRQYRYELGRAIVFGDSFIHATQTGESPRPLMFLCFTFGNRCMTDDQWRGAEEYISQQCPYYRDPKGQLVLSTAFGGKQI